MFLRKFTAAVCAVLIFLFLSTECFSAPEGAVLIDGKNGRVLFEINKDEKLPMASTTKIMTALIALEEENIDGFFSVNREAVTVEGSSMGLLPGDYVTLRGLAEGMLLSSGNDAANAAAIKISGSAENFVLLMNRRAEEMGLLNTSFRTPSGLDAENHFSTAYDMAILAKNALENPDFAEICRSESAVAEYGNPPFKRTLYNHNRLLKTLEGAVGIKTGYTKKAGRCLVSAAEREGVLLILATLGCPDDWDYHTALYEEYFKKLESVPLEEFAGKTTVPVCGGREKSVSLVPKKVSAALFEGEMPEVIISRPPFVFAPVKKGDILGKALFYAGGVLVAETPLLAENDVEIFSGNENFRNDIKDFFNF